MAKILSQPFLALGVTTTGIPFGGDVPMTDVFFLICSMEDRGHLQVLARLSRILTCSGFLNALHQAADAAAARQLIVETEENCQIVRAARRQGRGAGGVACPSCSWAMRSGASFARPATGCRRWAGCGGPATSRRPRPCWPARRPPST